jgi:hypothetical protein
MASVVVSHLRSWLVAHSRVTGLCMVVMTVVAGSAAASPIVVDFSDRSLAPNSFFNGGPTTNTTGWTSQGVFFGNGFTDWGGGFSSWNGFAYSNVNDTTTGDFTNQYASVAGTAFAGSIYAVGYSGVQSFIDLPSGYQPASVRVTNTTYAALDMQTGSLFSKPFGPGDFFNVTFTGYAAAGLTGGATGATTFYLADFRDGKSLIVTTWDLLDLTPLGQSASIGLSWDSSDTGPFGINTPTYVAIDALTLVPVPEPTTWVLALAAAVAAVAARTTWPMAGDRGRRARGRPRRHARLAGTRAIQGTLATAARFTNRTSRGQRTSSATDLEWAENSGA